MGGSKIRPNIGCVKMKKKSNHKIADWNIVFKKNVHMYCHDLSATKAKHRIQIQCEDLPCQNNTLGIWLYDLNISSSQKDELKSVLLQWANEIGLQCIIYISQDVYITNENND